MEAGELRSMRRKQIAVLNALLFIFLVAYFTITTFLTISFAHLFLVVGVLVLIQGIYGYIKGESTKSIIPILEKVAIYEKQKMGREWYKQRKSSFVLNIVLSCMLFLQSLSNWRYPGRIAQIDINFMIMLTLLFFILLNFSLFMHIRKVDRATSELDFNGYTWKSNLKSVVLGIVFAFIIISISIFYIMSTLE